MCIPTHRSIFSVLSGLKVELCWPLVSHQLQALQGPPPPPGWTWSHSNQPCLHLSCEGPAHDLHLLFIILIITTRPHPPSHNHHRLYPGWVCSCRKQERRGAVLCGWEEADMMCQGEPLLCVWPQWRGRASTSGLGFSGSYLTPTAPNLGITIDCEPKNKPAFFSKSVLPRRHFEVAVRGSCWLF